MLHDFSIPDGYYYFLLDMPIIPCYKTSLASKCILLEEDYEL